MPGLKAAFLDRDGTLIENKGFVNSVGDLLRCGYMEGAIEACGRLTHAGYELVLVTNQGGVGMGHLTVDMHAAIMGEFRAHLRRMGVSLTSMYACIHRPDEGCQCRKPAPGMLFRAARELGIDLSKSIMIGDREEDRIAGLAARCAFSWKLPDGGWPALDLSPALV
jgi:D-glycero-D-manno-heptose 1,7-bisphosphate phosphatase